MDERFLLEVSYRGETMKYDAEMRYYGYVYKVAVDIDGLLVIFEPDEEGEYRALVSPEQISRKDNALEFGLLQALAEELRRLSA